MSIRNGKQTDIDLLAAIEHRAGKLFPPGRVPDPDGTLPQGVLTKAFDLGLLFIAEADTQVAGFAVAELFDDSLHLAEVAVDPAAARQGFGRALVARVLKETQERGYAATTLTTFSDLPWNGPFYSSMGFREIAEADLSVVLRDILAAERAAGMTNRVAMLHPTSTGAPRGCCSVG